MPPTATTDTSAAPTLDQAFEQAKAEHSPAPESKTPAAAEHAPSAKTSETSDGEAGRHEHARRAGLDGDD
jgi:hypothetical protein